MFTFILKLYNNFLLHAESLNVVRLSQYINTKINLASTIGPFSLGNYVKVYFGAGDIVEVSWYTLSSSGGYTSVTASSYHSYFFLLSFPFNVHDSVIRCCVSKNVLRCIHWAILIEYGLVMNLSMKNFATYDDGESFNSLLGSSNILSIVRSRFVRAIPKCYRMSIPEILK